MREYSRFHTSLKEGLQINIQSTIDQHYCNKDSVKINLVTKIGVCELEHTNFPKFVILILQNWKSSL